MSTRQKSVIVFCILSLVIIGCTKNEKIQDSQAKLIGVNFQKLTLDEAKALAVEQGKLVLVDFFSPT